MFNHSRQSYHENYHQSSTGRLDGGDSVNISFSHMIRPGIFTLHGVRMDEGRWFLGGVLAADIFYILPTCVWDWTTEDGQSCRYSDYTRTDHIEAFRPSVGLAEDIFAQGQTIIWTITMKDGPSFSPVSAREERLWWN